MLKGLMDRIHRRFRVSIAETDFQDLHQRAEVGLALVHRSEREVNRMLAEIRALFDAEMEATVTDWLPELIEGTV